MNFFEKELARGVFQICDCKICDMIFWPPRENCHMCRNKTSWHESSMKGIIIEFSKKDSIFFGLVEIDNGIRILGTITSSESPQIGHSVRMNVGFGKKPVYSFFVEKN